MCLSTPAFVLKSGFFDTLGEQLHPSAYTFLSRQSRFPHPSQEMTFDRRLANITDPVLVFRGLHCPPLNIS